MCVLRGYTLCCGFSRGGKRKTTILGRIWTIAGLAGIDGFTGGFKEAFVFLKTTLQNGYTHGNVYLCSLQNLSDIAVTWPFPEIVPCKHNMWVGCREDLMLLTAYMTHSGLNKTRVLLG